MTIDLDESWRLLSPTCHRCRHRWLDDRSIDGEACAAFPNGIPKPIWNGDHDHRIAYAGDNGIRFEPRTAEEEAAFRAWLDRTAADFDERLGQLRRARSADELTGSRAD